MYVIRYAGLVGSAVNGGAVPNGNYLAFYDPEAYDGQGDALWAPELDKAIKFESLAAATECWSAVPKTRPLRYDGKANRPLTAISIDIEKLENE